MLDGSGFQTPLTPQGISMASDKLAEVLGFAPGTPRPNAYQLFGLKDGESDPKVITAAINSTLRRLKAAQGTSDPESWKQAAAAVTKARKILTDSDAKAAYDAKRFRRPPGEGIADPLQGLLPQYDPLAAFDLSAAAERVGRLRPPQPTVSDPAPATPSAVATEHVEAGEPTSASEPLVLSDVGDDRPAATPPLPAGVSEHGASTMDFPAIDAPRGSKPAARRRRRRGFPWAATFLTLMVLGMLGGIGFGIYVLADRERQTAQGGGATPPAAVDPPPQRPPRAPADPVMGTLAAEKNANNSGFLSADEFERQREQSATMAPEPGDPPESMDADDSVTEPEAEPSEEMTTDVPMAEAAEPKPSENDPPAQPGEAAQQAGQAAIDSAKTAILENNWDEMKSLAAEAAQTAAGDEQKARAQRLFQVADLADYYYVGLMQSLEDLNAGDQMELENIGTVGVVEANETTFAIQVNGRPKSFAFEEIPFFVVDAIAKLSMDLSDPTTRAAKAVHQAISPNAMPEHRRQSLVWLSELPNTLQGADPDDLQQAIQELYPNL